VLTDDLLTMYSLEYLEGRIPIQVLLAALPRESGTIHYQTRDSVVSAVFYIHKPNLKLLPIQH
jgi:hypothetical protein